MSDVEIKTDKPSSGYARLVLDEQEYGKVYFAFHDNFRHVLLTHNGIEIAGRRPNCASKTPHTA